VKCSFKATIGWHSTKIISSQQHDRPLDLYLSVPDHFMEYNSDYYESHYGRLLGNEPYFNLRALFWKHAIMAVQTVPEDSLLLDYGCGTGQVNMAFAPTNFYDIAEFSRDLLKKRQDCLCEQ
jgi:SAM-dependent methyltransferase